MALCVRCRSSGQRKTRRRSACRQPQVVLDNGKAVAEVFGRMVRAERGRATVENYDKYLPTAMLSKAV